MTRAPCRRRIGEEKFADLMTANHKGLNEEGESRNNHRYAVVVPDLATQQNQSVQNQNFSGDRRESTKVPRTVAKTKSYKNGQFRWNLSNLVKIHHGIIEHQHRTDSRRMLLLKKRYAEKKIFSSIVAIWLGWKSGGLILWNAIAICEMP